MRNVELVVKRKIIKLRKIPTDDIDRELHANCTGPSHSTQVPGVAIRRFPQRDTNPVNVLVANQPIRASHTSARWCIGVIEQLRRVRTKDIKPEERGEAEKVFQKTWRCINRSRWNVANSDVRYTHAAHHRTAVRWCARHIGSPPVDQPKVDALNEVAAGVQCWGRLRWKNRHGGVRRQ